MELLTAADPMCHRVFPILAKHCSPSVIAGFLAMLVKVINQHNVAGYAALAGHIVHRATSIDLLQRCNDLRLRIPALAHSFPLPSPEILLQFCADPGGQVISALAFNETKPI
jgi:hypothetical protein